MRGGAAMRMELEELRRKLSEVRDDTDVAAVLQEYTQRNYGAGSIGHAVNGGHVRIWTTNEAWGKFKEGRVAEEREACAKIAETWSDPANYKREWAGCEAASNEGLECTATAGIAAAIRKRGQP